MSHWWCCCPDIEVPPGPCACDQCAGGNAPCCWEVTLDGIANGSCQFCDLFNGVWYIKQTSAGSCVWSCTIDSGCTRCNTATLALSIADNKMTMTLGDHVWEKDFGDSLPTCSGIHSLSHVTSSGDCDTSAATCEIRAFSLPCPCGCVPNCEFCKPHTLPPYLAIDVGEVEDTEFCTLCSFYENRTYLVPLDAKWPPGSYLFGCSWRYEFSNCISQYDRGCGSVWGSLGCQGHRGLVVLIIAGSDIPEPGYKSITANFYITEIGGSITMASYGISWQEEEDYDCSSLDLTLTKTDEHYYCSWPETIRVYVPS